MGECGSDSRLYGESINSYIDPNGDAQQYSVEDALCFFSYVGDYDITDTERCKILTRMVKDLHERLAVLEAQLTKPKPAARRYIPGVAQVDTLSRKTGAKQEECREALVKHNGNLNEAADWLRNQGLAFATVEITPGLRIEARQFPPNHPRNL